jgi:hypothetical protein
VVLARRYSDFDELLAGFHTQTSRPAGKLDGQDGGRRYKGRPTIHAA